jgi:hypothetical protein
MKAASWSSLRSKKDLRDKENSRLDSAGGSRVYLPTSQSIIEPGKVGDRELMNDEGAVENVKGKAPVGSI